MITPTDTVVSEERLREILDGCEGVTPGPWGFEQTSHGMADMRVFSDRGLNHRHGFTVALVAPQQGDSDATHIARLDPATVASMARELLSLRTTPSLPPRSGGVVVKGLMEEIAALVPDDADRADDTEQQGGFRNAIEQVLHIISTLADPIPEAPADEEVEGVALAFIMAIAATDHTYRAERGPKNDWLFTCDEYINLSSALRAALRRSTETDKPGVREAALEEGNGWFKLFGDSRLGACATDGCGGQPTWRLEAGGVGSNYCSGCSARIRALSASPLTEEQPVAKFKRGDRVQKIKGSAWRGHVVGTYSTGLTPEGYNVESENEPGSVQLYPAAALEALPRSTTGGAK